MWGPKTCSGGHVHDDVLEEWAKAGRDAAGTTCDFVFVYKGDVENDREVGRGMGDGVSCVLLF